MAKKSSKVTRVLTCAYLYADGTLIEHYEENRDGVRIGTTVDVTFGFARVRMSGEREMGENGYSVAPTTDYGRLVIHREQLGIIPLMKSAFVRCYAPSVLSGSENSRKLNLKVSGVYVTCKGGAEVSWSMVDVLSEGFTVQVEQQYKTGVDGDAYVGKIWGHDTRINKITDLRDTKAA